MNELKIFENEEFGKVRTAEIDGKPYFAGTDVAKALGYSNPRDAIIRHCRYVVKHDGVSITKNQHGVETEQSAEMSFITEGDIYRLIVKSQLPSAERFEKWVFDEVLPSIRKNSGYIINQEVLTEQELMARALVVAQNVIFNKDKQIAELRPKADYFNELVDRNLLTSFRDTAKEFCVKEKSFIQWLLDNGYIYRDQKGKLKPYADKNRGLFELKEFSSRFSEYADTQTLITPKGRETFRLLLKVS